MSRLAVLLILGLLSPDTLLFAQPYLAGQDAPGDTARIYAPGLVNTGLFTRDLAMMPDGSEMYFGASPNDYSKAAIYVTRFIGGSWSESVKAPFAHDERWKYLEPAISADGSEFYFVSNRPIEGDTPRPESIWRMEREGDGWGEPTLLPEVINNGTPTYFPSVTRDGSIYFTRKLESGREVIVRSRRTADGYAPVEVLPETVNGGSGHFNAYVDPDERFIIVPTTGRTDGQGRTDYFVSFHDGNGNWDGPYDLGPKVNMPTGDEWSPYVSPDGAYLFFMRGTSNAVSQLRELAPEALKSRVRDSATNRLGLIWWIDASVIEEARTR